MDRLEQSTKKKRIQQTQLQKLQLQQLQRLLELHDYSNHTIATKSLQHSRTSKGYSLITKNQNQKSSKKIKSHLKSF